MRRVFIIESFSGVKVNPPNGAYHEEVKIGRYQVKALLFPNGYYFYLFKGEELKALISNDDDWFIGKLDGEGQNLLNRLLAVYG